MNEDKQTEQEDKKGYTVKSVTRSTFNTGEAEQESNRGTGTDDSKDKNKVKGLKVFRAQPNNAIDIYPLIISAAKDECYIDSPKERDLKTYYFQGLLRELASDYHLWFLARRGRGFLGFVHGIIIPGRWNGQIDTLLVDMVYVMQSRRKNGIAKKLIDEILKEAENIGVRRVEFFCFDSQVEYWAKERKAKKISNIMRVDL